MMHVLSLTGEIILRGRIGGEAVLIEFADTPRAIDALPHGLVLALGALLVSAGISISIELRAERRNR